MWSARIDRHESARQRRGDDHRLRVAMNSIDAGDEFRRAQSCDWPA
jgi:hypothetical protein